MAIDVVHGDHVGVGDASDGAGLAQEAGGDAVVGPEAFRVEELERDLTIEFGIEGAIDHRHAAGTDASQDRVAADPNRIVVFESRGHQRHFSCPACDQVGVIFAA